MKTCKNIDVIRNFFSHSPAKNYTDSLVSRDNKLFSYNTCIAEWIDEDIVINNTKYSPTTSKHQSSLRRVLSYYIIDTENIIFIDEQLSYATQCLDIKKLKCHRVFKFLGDNI